jgi:hypothetical protein
MKTRLRPYLITVLSILLASAALFVFLYTTADHDARENLKAEAMTVLMQLVAIGIIGGLVTWALNERSKEKDQWVQRQEKEKEQRVQRQDALNEFMRSAVTRVVTATNVVRKAPILIESHRSKKTYGEQSRTLLDARLDLGLLRHELESAKEAFTNFAEIQVEFRRMESYLDRIVDEWKGRYKDLPEPPSDAWDEIESLPALADLRKGDERSQFYNEYLSGHREALRLMREDVFGRDNRPGIRSA